MSGSDDDAAAGEGADSEREPEQLLAEALRAQARSAPDSGEAQASAPADASDDTGDDAGGDASTDSSPVTPAGYGLLSGAEAGSLERERAALDGGAAPADPADTTVRSSSARLGRGRPGLPARWVILLAILLGLATGSIVGLLTLL